MAKKTTKELTPEEMLSLIPKASPDSPIFKCGFVIGQRNSSHFSRSTQNEIPEEKIGKIPQASLPSPAYWSKPNGELTVIRFRHIGDVMARPEYYRETQEGIDTTLDKYPNEPRGGNAEGKARNEIMARVICRGYIRVREKNHKWTIQLDSLTEERVGRLQNWANMVIQQDKSRQYDDVFIHEILDNTKTRMTLKEVVNLKPTKEDASEEKP